SGRVEFGDHAGERGCAPGADRDEVSWSTAGKERVVT
ncbi:MAG: hypothetical protein JWP63_2157, partial [Candidatus Solibacter sp.]|nr:hypothetical protein [Candidatus Solibacter sp.]